MWWHFFLENIHFGLCFFAALVFFAMFWLYYDAWREKRIGHERFRLIGLLLLALSFVIEASQIEYNLLPTSVINGSVFVILLFVFRAIGYVLLIAGIVLDPLPEHPEVKDSSLKAVFAPLGIKIAGVFMMFPIASALVSYLYLRRATIGLERHMKKASLGFMLLAVSHLFSLNRLFQDESNSVIYNLVAPFGFFWLMHHLFLALAIAVLGAWVWQYLLTRVKTQMFMIFTASSLVIFVVTVTAYTGLMLLNTEKENAQQLITEGKMINLAIESKKKEMIYFARYIASKNELLEQVSNRNTQSLNEMATQNIVEHKLDSLIITDVNGKILARGEDTERIGDSVSDNKLLKSALEGSFSSILDVSDGALTPTVAIRAVAPLVVEERVVGAVAVSETVNNVFLEEVKKSTGLEVAIYGGSVLTASTITDASGESRLVGIKETSEKIVEKVLKENQTEVITKKIVNTPYLGAYLPLSNNDNIPVGMIFVGKTRLSVIAKAGDYLSYTFIITALMIVMSTIPSYYLARHFAFQLR